MSLSKEYEPRTFTMLVPGFGALATQAESELHTRALADKNRCRGYFPAMAGREAIDMDLPASAELAREVPVWEISGGTYGFNFLRLSTIRQANLYHEGLDGPKFHLDTDVKTAVTGDVENIEQRKAWRVLLNLHSAAFRQLAYLDINPSRVPLQIAEGHVYCTDLTTINGRQQRILLPPRDGDTVSGVVFCASQVLHAGEDFDDGHFVGAYGREQATA